MDGRSGNGKFDGTAPHDLYATASGERSSLLKPHPLDGTPLAFLSREVELFRTADEEPCITVTIENRQETWPLRTKGFRRWLTWRIYKLTGTPISSQETRKILEFLTAIALFEGEKNPLFTRIGEYADNIYIDLANDRREVIEVTVDGWRIVTEPPVRFYRPQGLAPLPRPEPGGRSLDDLRNFLHFSSEADFIMMVSWVLAAFRPTGPYPILVLQGEQDSAKSTATRVLRRLVDPHKTLMKRSVRDDRDLFISANNQWVLALDNLSHLQPWLSDSICTISTGGGYGTRKLYTDDEEINFNVTRPVVLNGIEDIATRGDIADRSVVLYLPSIPDQQRHDEKKFWIDFEMAQPHIFGALLDAVSAALCNIRHVDLQERPRMLDFAQWVCAAAPACAWCIETDAGEVTGAEAFMAAYTGNRQAAVEITLYSSDVAPALLTLAERAGTWRGTATDLLTVLHTIVGNARDAKFPKSASALSNTLRRLAPTLRRAGIHFNFERQSGGKARTITMWTDDQQIPSQT